MSENGIQTFPHLFIDRHILSFCVNRAYLLKKLIEQLANRHPWVDIQRVGIYGHSGGGFMSAAAVLQKPYNEFFKAAVASAGNHDNNIYNNSWAERYHGLKEVVVEKKEDGESRGRRSTRCLP